MQTVRGFAWNQNRTAKNTVDACTNGMQGNLQDELKAFEKELSILLVKFMKICDRVEGQRTSAPLPPQASAPVAPTPPKQKPIDLRAYV